MGTAEWRDKLVWVFYVIIFNSFFFHLFLLFTLTSIYIKSLFNSVMYVVL